MTTERRRDEALTFAVGIGVPLAVLLAMNALGLFLSSTMSGDAPQYWRLSAHLLREHSVTYSDHYHTYVYALFVAALRLATGDSASAVLFLQGALTVLACYGFTRRWRRTLNAPTLGLIVGNPFLLYYSQTLLPESLCIVLALAAFALLPHVVRSAEVDALTAAFLTTCALLTATKVHLLFFSLGLVGAAFLHRPGRSIPRGVGAVAAVAGGICLILAPTLINNARETRDSAEQLSVAGVVAQQLYIGAREFRAFPFSVSPDAKELAFVERMGRQGNSDRLPRLWLEGLIDDPFGALRNYAFKLVRVWVPMRHVETAEWKVSAATALGLTIFALFLLGLATSRRVVHEPWIFWTMLTPLVLLWVQQLAMMTESRYLVVARLPQMFFVGTAVTWAWERRRARRTAGAAPSSRSPGV